MEHHERLRTLLAQRSLFVGEFTLSSGAKSTYYIDARRTTLSAEGQFLLGRLGLEALRGSGWKGSYVGGLTMGADPVAYAIAHASWEAGTPIDAFTVRKAAKGHGTGRRIEGGLPENAHCFVVEDAVTSGASAIEAVAAVRAHGAVVTGVLAVVDREEGGRERLTQETGLPLIALFTARELVAEAERLSRADGVA